MGSLVEGQIRDAIRAMAERDAELAARVIAEDARVNDAQREITDTVLMTIATQSPVARDLRFLLALDHVASELERIGDHASGIAKQVRRMIEEPPLREIRDLARSATWPPTKSEASSLPSSTSTTSWRGGRGEGR